MITATSNFRIKSYSRTVLTICFLLLCCPAVSFSQQGEISVESKIDKAEVSVGELVLYEVTVRHAPEIEVTMPPPGINLGGFEIRDYNVLDPVEIDNIIERKVEYIIAAYDTGIYSIPPTGVLYMANDFVQNVLMTDEVTIRVKSILTGDMEDIIEIKDPLELVRNWNTIILLVAVGLVLTVFGILGFLYYRQKKRGKSLFEWKKEPEPPAHEEAIASLDKLRESSLLADGSIKEYYVQLSDIVRLYLQKRYFKPVMEMTTTQSKAALAEENIGEEALPIIELLLDDCDLVKFAKYLPAETVHEEVLQSGYDIVNLTKIESLVPVEEDQAGENSEPEAELTETAGEVSESSEKIGNGN